MQTVQRTLGVGVAGHRVSVLEFLSDVGLVFIGAAWLTQARSR